MKITKIQDCNEKLTNKSIEQSSSVKLFLLISGGLVVFFWIFYFLFSYFIQKKYENTNISTDSNIPVSSKENETKNSNIENNNLASDLSTLSSIPNEAQQSSLMKTENLSISSNSVSNDKIDVINTEEEVTESTLKSGENPLKETTADLHISFTQTKYFTEIDDNNQNVKWNSDDEIKEIEKKIFESFSSILDIEAYFGYEFFPDDYECEKIKKILTEKNDDDNGVKLWFDAYNKFQTKMGEKISSDISLESTKKLRDEVNGDFLFALDIAQSNTHKYKTSYTGFYDKLSLFFHIELYEKKQFLFKPSKENKELEDYKEEFDTIISYLFPSLVVANDGPLNFFETNFIIQPYFLEWCGTVMINPKQIGLILFNRIKLVGFLAIRFELLPFFTINKYYQQEFAGQTDKTLKIELMVRTQIKQLFNIIVFWGFCDESKNCEMTKNLETLITETINVLIKPLGLKFNGFGWDKKLNAVLKETYEDFVKQDNTSNDNLS